jgi:serine/threonine protein phosphatase PrpC
VVQVLLKSAAASHPGQQRENNEDRCAHDAAAGIFIVVDGVGGYAAGERAAEIAVERLQARLSNPVGSIAERIREAITNANNEIYRQAEENAAWHGMACVLTLALVEDQRVYWGHVGDTRLYKLGANQLKKLTRDHSPIGEREDNGNLTEIEAMRHPRRNEVYRDVGSNLHTPDDEHFIEFGSDEFGAAEALLLCSDGLTDMITQAQMQRIVNAHAGAPELVVSQLIAAANEAGGHDNVTVVYVENEAFAAAARTNDRVITERRLVPIVPPTESPVAAEREFLPVVPTPQPERDRSASGLSKLLKSPVTMFGLGIVVGILLIALSQFVSGSRARPKVEGGPTNLRVLFVNQEGKGGYRSISEALRHAQPNDTIRIDPGEYAEAIQLKDGVTLESRQLHQAVLRVEGQESAIFADGVKGAKLLGLRVVSGAQTPLKYGVLVRNSEVDVTSLDISGTAEAGIFISGKEPTMVVACHLHDNRGSGVMVEGEATPLLKSNLIVNNGKQAADAKPGLAIRPSAKPVLVENVFAENAADIWSWFALSGDELSRNWFVSAQASKIKLVPEK